MSYLVGRKRLCFALALLFSGVAATGCKSILLWPLLLIHGPPKVQAEYSGLEEQRVAVVCMSASSYGPDSTTEVLAREVEKILRREVAKVQLVDRNDIHNWIDTHEWNQVDYRAIGRDVRADKVVAIELSSYSLHAGDTLYQGKANVEVSVFDMKNRGKKVYQRDIPEFRFPANGEYPNISITRNKFERTFIQVLAQEIGNLFHDYALPDRFARDRTL